MSDLGGTVVRAGKCSEERPVTVYRGVRCSIWRKGSGDGDQESSMWIWVVGWW